MAKKKRIKVKKGIFAFSTDTFKQIQAKRVITTVTYNSVSFKIVNKEYNVNN